MRLTDLLASATRDAREPGTWTLAIPDDWRQGRAIFGGLQTALGLTAMRDHVPAELPLRTLQTTFLAPPSGRAVRVRALVLRQGKSATHVEARLFDAGDASDVSDTDDKSGESPLALVVGVFGSARPSAVRVTPSMPPLSEDKALPFRFVPGVTPTFTQHFDVRWLRGGMPFSGTSENTASVRVTLRDEATLDERLLVALADFMPPLALSKLHAPAPGSSLTWMLELLGQPLEGMAPANLRVDAELIAGADGYTQQSCMIWGPEGQPLALSRQTMVVFG